MVETSSPPFPQAIDVYPPRGAEHAQPVFANWISVSQEGQNVVAIDLFFLSQAFWRRVARGETGDGIERPSPGAVVCHVPPAGRLAIPLSTAADLVVALYAYVSPESRAQVDERLKRVTQGGEGHV